MRNHTQSIIDAACGLILIALLFVPLYAQRASDSHATANATRHVSVSAAYHKGANPARP